MASILCRVQQWSRVKLQRSFLNKTNTNNPPLPKCEFAKWNWYTFLCLNFLKSTKSELDPEITKKANASAGDVGGVHLYWPIDIDYWGQEGKFASDEKSSLKRLCSAQWIAKVPIQSLRNLLKFYVGQFCSELFPSHHCFWNFQVEPRSDLPPSACWLCQSRDTPSSW